MENNKNRYQQMQLYMSAALIAAAALFIVYLIAAGCGIIWLKVITAVFAIIISALCLAYLYITKLILAPRSIWMTFAAGAVILCTLFSLILNFPSPL